MPILDPARNLTKVNVDALYPLDAVTIELATGSNARLPDIDTEGAFNVVWWDSTNYPDPSDDPKVEIVRVTAKLSNDRITVTRGQESTVASSKNTPLAQYKMIIAPTKKLVDDIRTELGDLQTQINNINTGSFLKEYCQGSDDVDGSNVVFHFVNEPTWVIVGNQFYTEDDGYSISESGGFFVVTLDVAPWVRPYSMYYAN